MHHEPAALQRRLGLRLVLEHPSRLRGVDGHVHGVVGFHLAAHAGVGSQVLVVLPLAVLRAVVLAGELDPAAVLRVVPPLAKVHVAGVVPAVDAAPAHGAALEVALVPVAVGEDEGTQLVHLAVLGDQTLVAVGGGGGEGEEGAG